MMSPQENLPADFLGNSESAAASAARDLLIVTTLLVVFGLTMLYSTSYGVAGIKYFRMQIIWLVLGMGTGLTVFLMGYRRVAALWPFLILVVLGLLAAALFSPEVNGAHRWIQLRIPGLGKIGIQPSEFSKVILALTVA
ncbi:MAG: FtsW/RodA/SpoVE family cell cycle protein, partial [Lentisphaeria bacterium]|nr:FtsW/RodA/SpoVE family cell cycle protein [Lentisphaeria bacterium]